MYASIMDLFAKKRSNELRLERKARRTVREERGHTFGIKTAKSGCCRYRIFA